jgi:hypothetical protein
MDIPPAIDVAAEVQRLRARVIELDTQLLAAQLENDDLTWQRDAARQNVEREQAEHQAYRAMHPTAAARLPLPPVNHGPVDRLITFVVFRLTGRQLTAVLAISLGLVLLGRQLQKGWPAA